MDVSQRQERQAVDHGTVPTKLDVISVLRCEPEFLHANHNTYSHVLHNLRATRLIVQLLLLYIIRMLPIG